MIEKAAVKIKPFHEEHTYLIPCHRHADAYEILHMFGYKQATYEVICEGFITDSGMFLDRYEAAEYAYDHGQLVDDPETEHITQLFSEDLW